MDEMERVLNLFGSMIIGLVVGPFLIEYGLSRWQYRSFSMRSLWLIFVIGLGIRMLFLGMH